jgi:hypothetical protein
MISHPHKCVFVHIPKVAGQSIEHVFLERLGLTWASRAPLLLGANNRPELGPPRLAHLPARDYVRCHYLSQDLFDAYFTFAFVRNPWSRMVSMYRYLGYEARCDFNTFAAKRFEQDQWSRMFWFVRPQCDFIQDQDGNRMVDFVGRFESLQQDFNRVCGKLGWPETPLPHVNPADALRFPGGRLRRNIRRLHALLRRPRQKRPWRDYYDEETKARVAEWYREDIETFEYEFE